MSSPADRQPRGTNHWGSLLVVGLSHRTAPLELRERITVPESRLRESLEALAGVQELEEKVLLSTCNRVELYAAARQVPPAEAAIKRFLSEHRGVPLEDFETHLYRHVEGECVVHLFRVASSLDSMVVGEPQVLGQVKAAYTTAQEVGCVGPELSPLFERAFGVAKRVRTETDIGKNRVSVSQVAVDLARKIFVSLSGKSVLVVGAGKMAELALRHLVEHGARAVLVANRNYDRAVQLAAAFDGRAIQFDAFSDELPKADIVICSTGAPHYVVRRDQVAAALRVRRSQPMFLIDIAVPRNVDPAVNDLEHAFLYDIDDLQKVVEESVEGRSREAERAEGLLRTESEKYLLRRSQRNAAPTIVALRSKVEAIREAEVRKLLPRMNRLSEEELKQVEYLTAAIVQKILHEPISNLKREVESEQAGQDVDALRRLFNLDL